MIRAPTLVGRGVVKRLTPKVVAVPAARLSASGAEPTQDLMVTIRQTTRLRVAGTASAIVTVKPGDVTALAAVAPNANTVLVSWVLPTSGGVVTSVELNRRITLGGTFGGNLLPAGISTSFVDSGKAGNTGYTYRVRTVSDTSNGDFVSVAVTTPPDIVTGAATFVISAGTATATFDGSIAQPKVGGGTKVPAAGDIIELASGTHGIRTFNRVVGGVSNRIVIRGPTTGQAVIRKATPTTSDVFNFNACRYFDIDGSTTDTGLAVGADGKRHNLKVMYATSATGASNDNPQHWINFSGVGSGTYNNCRDFTLRYVEVDGGFPTVSSRGIGISTNDHSFKADTYPGEWQENMTIEHNWIHNVWGAGMYIGPNSYMSVRGTGSEAGGRDVPLRNVIIQNNLVTDTGQTGILGKSWFDGVPGVDNAIRFNIVLRVGGASDPNNSNGIGLTSCRGDIYGNWVELLADAGIQYFVDEGVGVNGSPVVAFPTRIFNNLVLRPCQSLFNKAGINSGKFGGTPTVPSATVSTYNNTVFASGSDGINYNTVAAASFIRNNISVDNVGGDVKNGPGSQANNTTGASTGLFVDIVGSGPTQLDFHLQSAIAASGAVGTDIASVDYEGDARIALTADRGAYEFP